MQHMQFYSFQNNTLSMYNTAVVITVHLFTWIYIQYTHLGCYFKPHLNFEFINNIYLPILLCRQHYKIINGGSLAAVTVTNGSYLIGILYTVTFEHEKPCWEITGIKQHSHCALIGMACSVNAKHRQHSHSLRQQAYISVKNALIKIVLITE